MPHCLGQCLLCSDCNLLQANPNPNQPCEQGLLGLSSVTLWLCLSFFLAEMELSLTRAQKQDFGEPGVEPALVTSSQLLPAHVPPKEKGFQRLPKVFQGFQRKVPQLHKNCLSPPNSCFVTCLTKPLGLRCSHVPGMTRNCGLCFHTLKTPLSKTTVSMIPVKN